MRRSQRHVIEQALSALLHGEAGVIQAKQMLDTVTEDFKEPPGNEGGYKATSEVVRELRDALCRLRAARNQMQGMTEIVGKDPF